MLMDEFRHWVAHLNPEDFAMFYAQKTKDQDLVEMVSELAEQIEQMQVVIEGLLEDQDAPKNCMRKMFKFKRGYLDETV
jgi:hypothetical protein